MPLPILPLRLTPKNPLILHHNPIIIRVKKATNIQLTIKIETKDRVAKIEDKSIYKITKIYVINNKWRKKKYWCTWKSIIRI